MFSFEFRKIFKKTFFIEHLRMTASVINYLTIVMMYWEDARRLHFHVSCKKLNKCYQKSK